MSRFKKKDLKRVYQWTTDIDDTKLKGTPDSNLFNRKQGWEILYLANKFLDAMGLSSVDSLHKFESLIAEMLPGRIRSQRNVYQWLIDNWEYDMIRKEQLQNEQ
jgi:hypothetical protein